ncbi:hypothetical protein QE152_g13644 [Popillia japonica]|uniref:Integrase catalytic domain-containing protein n=1 Tax=Popillia japonica TaxID=7064 RepID=A0AAW1L987_POPJA
MEVDTGAAVNFIPLLGRDWLDLLNPSWKSPLNFHSPVNVKCIQPMSELESKFPNVFATNQKSTIKGYKAKLIVKEGSGIIHKPYSLAYALRPKVEEELKIMVENDNGPPFGSITFQQFCMSNGIILQHSPPYHPQSNGLAEKTVDTIKRSLKKQLQSKKESLQHSIDNFLFAYRNTPSTSTNRSPSELIFKQLPRTKLSLLRPREAERKDNNEGKGKRSRKYFTINEKVYAYMTLENIWIPGKIVKVLTSNTYLVLVRGNVRHMHVDHLKKDNTLPVNLPITNLPYSSPQCLAEETEKSNLPVVSNDIPTATFTENKDLPTDISVPPSPCEFPTTTPELRRSQRTIRPPERLDL